MNPVESFPIFDNAAGLTWSPDGELLVATGRGDNALRVWNKDGSQLLWSLTNSTVGNLGRPLSWLRDGQHFVVATDDRVVLVIDPVAKVVRHRLEGYGGAVQSTSVSADGVMLATADVSGLVRLWDTRDWTVGPAFHPASEQEKRYLLGVVFHPTAQRLITIFPTKAHEWGIDFASLFAARRGKTVKLTSAKVVLVGESNVGKSTLALRLSENRYPTDAEHG